MGQPSLKELNMKYGMETKYAIEDFSTGFIRAPMLPSSNPTSHLQKKVSFIIA